MSGGAAGERPAVVVGSGGVGPALRAARERRGLSIAAVTEALHVEARVIEAMETGRFSVFDAPVYARGFIRKYGAFLELPVDDLIAAYDSLSGGPATPTLIPVTAAAPVPRDLSKLRIPVIFVLALALVGGSYWWWLGHAPASSSAPPARAVTAAAVATPVVAAAPVEASAAPTPAVADSARPPASERAVTRTAPTPRPNVAAASLVVTGLRECWVEVYSPNGARLLYDLVQAGDSRALPGPGPWKVFLGNFDGVRLSMDERAIVVPVASRAGATARFIVTGDGAVK